METLFSILLVIHIASGFTALIVGIIPMIARKGGKLHNRSGKIYFWAMFGVFISSQPMAYIKGNEFLFTIGIFSFYLALSGFRFARKKGWDQLQAFDKSYMLITFITSLVMLGYTIYYALNGSIASAIILGIFGLICLVFSGSDLRRIGKKGAPKRWIILHIIRMIGAYVATFTAFAVTNINFLPDLVLWIGPTIIGSIGTAFSIIYYRKKFNIK